MVSKVKKHFGYIEGYYGRLLTWEQRFLILGHLSKLNLNTYLYAPKEDAYHRLQWREQYPENWVKNFKKFLKEGKALNVNVVPSVAPGLLYDYKNEAHYTQLKEKIWKFYKMGAESVALLMDDVPMSLPKINQEHFSSLGMAHGELLQKLWSDVQKSFPSKELWFCPTIYAGELIPKGESTYLVDLTARIPKEVPVFWTGSHVIAPTINTQSLEPALSHFGNQLMVWDNYYANDYCPDRLFIGPFHERYPQVLSHLRGYFINPTGLLNTDIFYLMLLKGFVRNQPALEVWHKAVKTVKWPDLVLDVLPLMDGPFTQTGVYSEAKMEKLRSRLRYFIFEWNSDFRTEWFIALQILLRDLNTEHDSSNLARLRKYTPFMKHILEKRFGKEE